MRFSAITSLLLACPSIILAAAVKPSNVVSRSSHANDVDIAPSVYIHPGFVADRDHHYDDDTTETPHTPSAAGWEMPFNASSSSEKLCGHNLTIPYSVKDSKIKDCLGAMGMLLSMHGHWDTSGWRHAIEWHRFFGYGTCNVWVKSDQAFRMGTDYGNEIRIGNRDIFLRIRDMVEHHSEKLDGEDVTGGMGDLWCLDAKDVKVNWSINHS